MHQAQWEENQSLPLRAAWAHNQLLITLRTMHGPQPLFARGKIKQETAMAYGVVWRCEPYTRCFLCVAGRGHDTCCSAENERSRKKRAVGQSSVAVDAALGRAFQLDLFMSTIWGLVPWLLWEPGNLTNHVFLVLILLSVGVRLLVSRAASMSFFCASFGPVAGLLFIRLIVEWNSADIALAALIRIYAGSLVFDARRHTAKSFAEAQLRFGMDKMATEREGRHIAAQQNEIIFVGHCKRRRAGISPGPFSIVRRAKLNAVVHFEFNRMGRVFEGVHFLHL